MAENFETKPSHLNFIGYYDLIVVHEIKDKWIRGLCVPFFIFFNIYQRHICSTDQKNTWLGLVDDIYINVNFSYKIINET